MDDKDVTAVVKIDTTTLERSAPTPADIIQSALASGIDLEKLDRLLDLQLKWEANEARKAFTTAMAEFKKDPPTILKDRHVKFKTSKGMTEYKHASLGAVVIAITSAMGSHGLSASWDCDQGQGGIKVTCTITHTQGHSECVSMTSPPDTSGIKNPIQSISSTISYLQRYTLLAVTGLATTELDDDGRTAYQPPKDTESKPQTSDNGKKELTTEERAQKAVQAFGSLVGVIQGDIERKVGRPLAEWDDSDIDALLSIYGILKDSPVKERAEKVMSFFELEPGAMG